MLASVLPKVAFKQADIEQSSQHHSGDSGLKMHRAPLVLVHGWGANSQIWQSLPSALGKYFDVYTLDLPGFGSNLLEEYTEQSLVEWLHAQLPDRCYLVGLSLGGMLCRAYAAKYPQSVMALITISTNLRFVANQEYPSAMPAEDFASFSRGWSRDPQLCLNRFAGLQSQGDVQQRQLIRQLRNMDFDFDNKAAGELLALLSSLDGTEHIKQINCPSLAIFGRQDCLVPIEAANQLPACCEKQIVDKAGHLPHLSFQSEVVAKISQFIEDQLYRLDKLKVAQSFGRAADQYDRAAIIQKWSGEQLLGTIRDSVIYNNIADLGCGTGTQSSQLKQRFPQAHVTAVDFSDEMLAYARSKHHSKDIDWLCSDAENLAMDDASQTLLFSNFALQWCTDINRTLREIYRVLDKGGQFYFAVPGPKTLWELRHVWAQIDEDIHINRFVDSQYWHDAMHCAGFKEIDLSGCTKIEYHQSVRDLMLNLKTVGANNNNSGKPKHLTGKSHIKRLYAGYEQFKTSRGTIPATWEIIFGSAVK